MRQSIWNKLATVELEWYERRLEQDIDRGVCKMRDIPEMLLSGIREELTRRGDAEDYGDVVDGGRAGDKEGVALPLGTVVETTLFGDHDMVIVGPRSEGYAYAAAPLPAGQVLIPEKDAYLHTFALDEEDVIGVRSLGWLGQGGPLPVDPLRTLLPLGSVVELRDGRRALAGLYAAVDGQGAMRDYLGYRWPDGYREGGAADAFFDAADIASVLFLGYVDAGVQEYCANFPVFARANHMPLPFLRAKKLFPRKLELTR